MKVVRMVGEVLIRNYIGYVMKNLRLALCVSCAFTAPVLAGETAAPNEAKVNVSTQKATVESAPVAAIDTAKVVATVAPTESKEARVAPLKGAVSTLANALAAAYDNNPGLLQARQALLAKHEAVAQEKAGFLPSITSEISLTGSKSQISGSAKTMPGNNVSSTRNSVRSGNITLQQNLFAGGATMAAVLSADQSIRGLWAELLSNEQKTFSEVIKAYLDLMSKISIVDVRKANHTALKKNYETAYEKHKIGEEPLTQVANAESKLAGADADLRSAEAEVVGAKATLASLIGVEAVNVEKPNAPTSLPQTLEAAIAIAVENNPAVIKAQFDHKAAEASIDKANGKYLPSIDLRARSQRDETSGRNIGGSTLDQKNSNYQTNNSVVVSMSYDLYSGGKYSSQKRQAHDDAVAKRISIEAAKTDIIGSVKLTFEQYHAAKTNIDNYKKQVKAADVALQATRQELEVGTKVLWDVLDAQTKFVDAQVNLINAEKIYFQSAYQMVSLLGGLHAKAMKLSVNYFDPETHYDNISVGF